MKGKPDGLHELNMYEMKSKVERQRGLNMKD